MNGYVLITGAILLAGGNMHTIKDMNIIDVAMVSAGITCFVVGWWL